VCALYWRDDDDGGWFKFQLLFEPGRRVRVRERFQCVRKSPLIWFITHNFLVFDFFVCFSFFVYSIFCMSSDSENLPLFCLFSVNFPVQSKKKNVLGYAMNEVERGGGRMEGRKNVKRSKSPWVKILKVDARVYDAEPFLCVWVFFRTEKGYYRRKKLIVKKKSGNKYSWTGWGRIGYAGQKRMFSFRYFPFFEACCWLLRLAVLMCSYVINSEGMERKEMGKSDNTKNTSWEKKF
jgi:hypothetical protein